MAPLPLAGGGAFLLRAEVGAWRVRGPAACVARAGDRRRAWRVRATGGRVARVDGRRAACVTREGGHVARAGTLRVRVAGGRLAGALLHIGSIAAAFLRVGFIGGALLHAGEPLGVQ